MAVRILIADDHKIVRDGLKALLESETDFEVIGEAGTGLEASKLIRKLEPDVAVVDIGMPELNGIEVTRKMVTAQPQLKVVALTMHADRRFVAGMFACRRGGVCVERGGVRGIDYRDPLSHIRADLSEPGDNRCGG